jgi:uncharacterized protein (DUF1501 family)/uncharacterized protein (DUF1800 family)
MNILLLLILSLLSQFPVRVASSKEKRSLQNNAYSCPAVGSSPQIVPSNTVVSLIASKTGEICTLSRVGSDGSYAPVGRSYDGLEWESVAGPYTSLRFNCSDGSCSVTTPPSETSDQQFVLTTFQHKVTKREEVARFFEQVTFGTTPDDLYNVDIESDLDSFYSEWVHDQIYQTPETLHRSWWRTRTSSMYEIPGKEGTQIHPCSVGSRWRSKAFSRIDKGRNMHINKVNGRYQLSVGNVVRTTVGDINLTGGVQIQYNGPRSYRICNVDELLGTLGIQYKRKCRRFQSGNPSISIEGLSDPQVVNLKNTPTSKYKLTEITRDGVVSHVLVLTDQLYLSQCSELSYPYSPGIYAQLPNGDYLIHEPTLELGSNTDTSPLWDGGGGIVSSSSGKAMCSNVPQTFINQESCHITKGSSGCSPNRLVDGVVRLNSINLKRFFRKTNRPVYAVSNLRLSDDASVSSPCTYGTVSRWKPVDSCNQNIQPQTANIFRPLIRTSLTFNSKVIDVIYEDDVVCDARDLNKIEMNVRVDGKCYTTVHPDEGDVYDFSQWAQGGKTGHPGNTAGYNPIMKFANNGQIRLTFPNSHPMSRWNLNKSNLVYVGRLGDDVDFIDLPTNLKTDDVASALGVNIPREEGSGLVVCGSRGEVRNKNTETYSFQITRGSSLDSMTDYEFSQQRKKVWTMIALQASDQLRQRVAWALSQLLVISPSDVTPFYTETFLTYYDIFVRHAFGNYRDILKEVSYSPMMADMLSYFESKSSEYVWKRYRTRQFADENFAREVMQLFSIGLFKMNMDGTPVMDENENIFATYTNEDITEYARVWTGFTRQPGRGNVEDRDPSGNSIDPMRIKIGWRDQSPKMGLDGKYIGDGYVPCEDLPQDMFLRKGAEYRLLGKSKISELQDLMLQDSTDSSKVIVTILPNGSRLKNRLCGSFNDSLCEYKGVVKLQSSVACTGTECNLSSIRIVQVAEGVFYEYVPPPCVNFPFIQDGIVVSKSRVDFSIDSACVSKSISVAAGACCDVDKVAIHNTCQYTGERVTLPIAQTRCADIGKNICNYSSIRNNMCGKCCNYSGYYWTDTGCSSFAIIDADGRVAMERFGNPKTNAEYESLTYFRVHWGNEGSPSINNSCGGCEIVGKFCRCGITVQDTIVFSSVPSRNDVLSTLHIGGLPPSLNDFTTERDEGSVKLYSSNPNNLFTKNTVFEVTDDFGRILFLKNLKSNVIVGSNGYNFRSPPSFYSVVPEARDAHYETDAAIDHYFYNSNTPPFLAIRLLQRFGVSNPSPGYIERVSSAFWDGIYHSKSISIGSGKYGDLSATVASIVLDRESRNVLIDADPASGSIREPLIKLIALMRNMQYQQTDGDATYLHNLQARFKQESHEMPDVFSFFLPEYAPPGVIADASLVSPEALILPSSLELIDGMISLIKYGLSRCFSGFGNNKWCQNPQSGNYNEAAGHLSFQPVSTNNATVIDEIATLLTSGRMNKDSRQLLHNIYSKAENKDEALRWTQQLAILSPAFHTTGTNEVETEPRPESSVPMKTCNKYKAVVHIVLAGGVDSYNMLVPHSACSRRNLYEQYRTVRGSVALSKDDLLQIDASTSLQPCNRFGIHPSLPIFQELYNSGDAMFLAGIGVLSKPVTKSNYRDDTKTRLFAHNTMQSEVGRLDPYKKVTGTANLGRLADELLLSGFSVSAFSIDTSLTALHGKTNRFSKVAMNSRTGFRKFNPSGQQESNDIVTKSAYFLNGIDKESNGVFSKTWSSFTSNAVQINEDLYRAQESGALTQGFPNSLMGIQLKRASQLIASHECRGSDRDVIYIKSGGYDHHANVIPNLRNQLNRLNAGLTAFVNELKAQDNWDDTVIVISSEFGRTLTPNSKGGTDHGWSGHGIMLGGSVKGGMILGEYPDDLSSSNPLDTGRGRLIPTMPFDAPWNAVSQWLGIDDESSLDRVLPNRMSFDGMLLSKADIFNDDADTGNLKCEDESDEVSCMGNNENEETDDMIDDFFEYFDDDEDSMLGNNENEELDDMIDDFVEYFDDDEDSMLGNNENEESDDMIDDFVEYFDDDDDEDSILDVDSNIGGGGIVTAAMLSVLFTITIFGVALLVNRRTGILSRFLSFSKDSGTFAWRSKKACLSCLTTLGCFSFVRANNDEPESDCDERTAAIDTSFEVDHSVLQLLQYSKKNEEVAVAE